MSEYVLSDFAHLIGENTSLIWNSLRFKKIDIDCLTAQYLRSILKDKSRVIDRTKIDENIFFNLVEEKIIVKNGEDETTIRVARKQVGLPQIQSLFLITTRMCNLDCVYCFYNKDNSQSLKNKSESMSEEIALRAIDVFAELSKDNQISAGYWQAVTFYGGEPLLNLPVIKAAIDYARLLQKEGKLYNQLEFIVNTNGTLVGKEFMDLAQRENLEVQISLDGFREIHDICRPTKNGQGSFDKALQSIKLMSEMGINVVPMITVTEANMEGLPKFITWLCTETKIKKYIMNLLMSTTGDTMPNYGKRAAEAMWQTHCASSVFGVYDNGFVSQLNKFFGPVISEQGCGANGRKITVFPEGETHTCQSLEKSEISLLGNLASIKNNNTSLKIWRNRSKFNNEKCLKCPMLGACDNGCAAGAFHSSGDIGAIDPNHCQWLKALFAIWLEG
ncbi:MAG: radical SAM protein [Candidatus Paceibacterota bacterium]